MTAKQALIIGGGIGGLAAAVALQRAGLAVTVCERVPELREAGAGITLWSNAVKALDKLGLPGLLSDLGAVPTQMTVRSWRGDELIAVPADALKQRFRVAPMVVHRARLHAGLLKAAGDVVRLDARCTGFVRDEQGVTAQFADGSEARADLLIGADGVHSAVREHLLGAIPLRYSGYTSWRGITRLDSAPLAPGAGFEAVGPGRRFGVTHLSGGGIYWYATLNTPAGGKAGPGGHKQELLTLFRGWLEPVEALIAGAAENEVLRTDIFDLPPLRRWGEGRVTLLGDAVHPMTPNLGQGACQAIEDAVVLGRCLNADDDISGALRTYEAERRPRTGAIVTQAQRLGRVMQWQNPFACAVRDALFKLTPASVSLKQMESVVGYEV